MTKAVNYITSLLGFWLIYETIIRFRENSIEWELMSASVLCAVFLIYVKNNAAKDAVITMTNAIVNKASKKNVQVKPTVNKPPDRSGQ